MRLSDVFVAGLLATLQMLVSSVTVAINSLQYAMTSRSTNASSTNIIDRLPPPRNSRHGSRLRVVADSPFPRSERVRSRTPVRLRPMNTSSTWYMIPPSNRRLPRHPAPELSTVFDRHGDADLLSAAFYRISSPPASSVSSSSGSLSPDPEAASVRPPPRAQHGPSCLLDSCRVAMRTDYPHPFQAWTQTQLDELIRRKTDKDSRPTYKSIAKFLTNTAEK